MIFEPLPPAEFPQNSGEASSQAMLMFKFRTPVLHNTYAPFWNNELGQAKDGELKKRRNLPQITAR